ncbi:phosphatase PAP2 family protein [Pigmentiphaga aceris]|uniref:Phosphatase PAP2 family protein n=1 Tax=Pigmentiphaga aceris TaxID=1940612 RepID=A0A5C0B121_9BURK|nr:phosphatase PAP2 family protein [Pigmentiphaga aceris]QEI06820.1 phosphatase PAP2 family protein [Pigmentiphaga aceris]
MSRSYIRGGTLAVTSVVVALSLAACGGGDDDSTPVVVTPVAPVPAAPAAPAGVGFEDTAPVANVTTVPPFVDNVASNQRGDARFATMDTNAGVRVLSSFLDVWKPSSLIVDAGVTAPANGNFPAVTPSTWTGIPGDATDGTKLNATVLDANIQYVINTTRTRTPEQALIAYLDDRRGKAYSVTDALGPLTNAWRTAAQQTTTINDVPADATTVLYNDGGNNIGVGGTANPTFGTVIDLLGTMGANASTEPAKRFYKYARPFRWSTDVVVLPALLPARSSTPATDGGFPSGHTAEAGRNTLGMAYIVPERFQELALRGVEMGQSRILAGMHSPFDVIGGRIQSIAAVAANLNAATPATRKAAYDQAHTVLMAATNTTTLADFYAAAHASTSTTDRFADYSVNKANNLRWMTFGFPQIGDTTKPAVVPKGAEILLETRFPYLDANQRRIVLKSTALPSGYPAMDDAEGWGRLNIFDAGGSYGAFNGDVSVTMNAALGGFNARDSWVNDIKGAGKLTKAGTGTLRLTGANTFAGGTEIKAGTIEAGANKAFGNGDVYVGGGTVLADAPSAVTIGGNYTQLAAGALQLRLASDTSSRLSIAKTATLAGTLTVTFANNYRPAIGSTISLLSASTVNGTFSNVTVTGYRVTPVYTSTGVQVRIDG